MHDRYHPAKRNPFNEIECGDHYARAIASWGVLTGLAGFTCHGPHGHVGFAPRLTPENFKSAFTAAEGWGSFEQHIDGQMLSARVIVAWGRLRICSLALDLPPHARLASAKVTVASDVVVPELEQQDHIVTMRFRSAQVLESGDALVVELRYA